MRQIIFLALLTTGMSVSGFLTHNSFAEITGTNVAQPTQKEQYTCPMHPQVKSDQPGSCPICHMNLVKMKVKTKTVPDAKPSPESRDSRKIKYYRHPMDPSIHSKTPAKDSMGMDFIPVYEPDNKKEESKEDSKSKIEGRGSFQLTPEQLKLSGTRMVSVVRKTLVKTLRVPGRVLSAERISFQVFEQDLAFIKSGMTFHAEASMFPGERFTGQITSIESILDPMTRTARVNGNLRQRLGQTLRTEASLSGTIEVRLPDVLALPESSVLHTGAKDLLFITDGKGSFSPREVILGAQAQGFYEIKKGVNEGEQVSSGPNFLLDSESRIQFSYDSTNN